MSYRQSNCTADTVKNRGNIARQTLSFNGITHPLVQSYKYDALYRITEATETANSVANWFQTWGYDRYGNRTAFAQNIGGNPASVNPAIITSSNRFDEAGTNFDYDLNGNLIRDGEGRQFTFNGDNKQTVVKDANNNTIGQYFYDGEGKRVKKISNSETTIFVYSGGKLVAEYSTQLSSTPAVSYMTSDHLGSPRVITDAIGQATSRRDFLPYGEDLLAGVGSRTTANRYGATSDDLRQKFTGYQKDTETSLDFAEARMYDNRFGRFTAVDPLLASGKSANPQTFNRYVYTSNSPLARTDPDGRIWLTNDGGKSYKWVDDKYYQSKDGQKKYAGYTDGNLAIYTLGNVSGKRLEKYKHLIGKEVQNMKDGSLREVPLTESIPHTAETLAGKLTDPNDMPTMLETMPILPDHPSMKADSVYKAILALEIKTGQDILPEYAQVNANLSGGEVSGILTRHGDLVGCFGANQHLFKSLIVNPVKAMMGSPVKMSAGVSLTANKVVHLGRYSREDNLSYAKGISGGVSFGRGWAANIGVNSTFRPAFGLGLGLGGGINSALSGCVTEVIPLTDGRRLWE